MKVRKIAILILALVALAALAAGLCACSSSLNLDGLTCVTYELEGGEYKNSARPVKQYYNLKEGGTVHLVAIKDDAVERRGYTFTGWYRTKSAEGEYSDEWDFANDVLSADDEITLYAGWSKKYTYSYAVCYIDEDGNEVELGRYNEVYKGDRFNDSQNYLNQRAGYTNTGHTDVYGNPWDENFMHPGGEDGTTVKVYGQYIEGEYTFVSDYSELKAAARGSNIYLLNDIECTGDPAFATNGVYSHELRGNGFAIKNIKVSANGSRGEDTLEVSLFGNLDGAKISNVRFENVQFTIAAGVRGLKSLKVAPVAITAKNSVIEDVTFEGTYEITDIVSGVEKDITENQLIKTKDGTVTESGSCSATLTDVTPEEISGLSAAAYVLLQKTRRKEYLSI